MNALTMSKDVARVFVLLAAGAGTVLSSGTTAQAQPVFPSEITEIAPQGFGDRDNSQAWAMAWWNGKLYVGTGRSTFCVQQATLEFYQPDMDPYPPKDKDVSCTPDPHDLKLQAEIWRWTPATNAWDRVYQSPNDVPIEGTDKFTAREIGLRGMVVFTESDGTQALYVAGDSTRGGQQGTGFDGPVPPPRILRSTDGTNFAPIPQDPGTFLGDIMTAGFRSLKVYKGKMYAVTPVGQLGHGYILEAADPKQGNKAWRMVSPPGKTFFEIEVYNGFLWAGTGVNPQADETPFSLMKTDATGDPYTWTTVIHEGGYRKSKPSAAVISLGEFQGRLYVGTDRELLRVNPDDSWQLVVGTPRKLPDGSKLEPLSGFDTGFDSLFNIHMWRMGTFANWLYVGTQDQSAKWRNLKGGFGNMLKPSMGFDLFGTNDGWHYSAITKTGLGDLFNNGMRNFASSSGLNPPAFFMGSANHSYGTRIYKAVNVPTLVGTPTRMEVESAGKIAAIYWEGAPTAVKFHVFRSSGYAAPVEIGSTIATPTTGRVYVDQTLKPFGSYHYYVVGEDLAGNMSEPSNLVRVPFKGPVPTIKSLETLFTGWGAPVELTTPLAEAKAALKLEVPDFVTATAKVQAMAALVTPPTQTLLLPYRAQDLLVLLTKFGKRVVLVQNSQSNPTPLPVRILLK